MHSYVQKDIFFSCKLLSGPNLIAIFVSLSSNHLFQLKDSVNRYFVVLLINSGSNLVILLQNI